ncbi:NAD-dependent protein deacylase [Virgibacillus halodenitrificans]|uniref:NAD-dependent protein deacetylase n=1 Tax=Virgibacillus halodenitrificans TaxID=1482 RepID=A0AAC9J228_VIRHA|nr:NAD-dependent protein deacylase [Virgibacillus halodenitrificans]APC49996.1 NAD-dependent protein deacylase [Virgibacillus halodenitrificans]MBD1222480.1 NAD-dependent protein deacylase [Virgibacillus halodenitrificans]MCG1027707.1 NAD-dependent protein deacylase [Virgibacillus halodenitrificans]MCJ0932155.1 NAD-dependent protein deacylase [Virgibacillus halodenitrificans]MYL44107.1 NAD-dependent protein deacylase [Virgibacillus halodenitrificans]
MLKKWLQNSNYTVVFTGAGMSTESGLPDFRSSNQGLWNKKDPSKIASTDALNNNVNDFISFYRERVLGVKEYSPHKGHYILADLEKQGYVKSIITQNVDGFHQQAGSKNVAELHGTLQTVHCQSCGEVYSSQEYVDKEYYCTCGGILRPSIILFGETLPQDAFQFALEESRKSDLFIVLGSSLSVTPANQFPLIAKEMGAKLVIINREKTPFDYYADQVIRDQAIGKVLAGLDM